MPSDTGAGGGSPQVMGEPGRELTLQCLGESQQTLLERATGALRSHCGTCVEIDLSAEVER
jgi:hypothetical protein